MPQIKMLEEMLEWTKKNFPEQLFEIEKSQIYYPNDVNSEIQSEELYDSKVIYLIEPVSDALKKRIHDLEKQGFTIKYISSKK